MRTVSPLSASPTDAIEATHASHVSDAEVPTVPTVPIIAVIALLALFPVGPGGGSAAEEPRPSSDPTREDWLGPERSLHLTGRRPARVPIAFNRFYDHDEVVVVLGKLAEAFPKLLRLTPIGRSVEGRDLWLATISNPDTGAEDEKAAMYIDANIHGNEIQGTEVCLYTMSYLLERYDDVPRVRRLVDERVFYFVPMVNPDGRAYWFEGPNTSDSSRSGKKPVDDDGDGAFDEDGYDDIDGDGEILGMWKRDDHGDFRRDPGDPRVLVRTKPGEAGEFVFLGLEGIDRDGDGMINEDPPGGYDMNRNWPADWQPGPLQRGAGDYPLSFPETRSIAEFIAAHPNIAGVQAYHNFGGMILRGPGDGRLGEYPGADVAVYDELGETGELVLPAYRYMVLWKDLYRVHGCFINWTYEGLGIFSFTNELFARSQYGIPSRGDDEDRSERARERLRWDDLLQMEEQFVELRPARHPLYGEIFLGGYRKTAARVPPLFLLEELCHRNAMFTLYHAWEMPRVGFRSVEIERVAGQTFHLTVTLENPRATPSRSALAARKRLGRPDVLEVIGPRVRVLEGGRLLDRFRGTVSPVEEEPHRLRIEEGVGGKGSADFRFLLRGEGEVTVTYLSEKGGRAARRVLLPRSGLTGGS